MQPDQPTSENAPDQPTPVPETPSDARAHHKRVVVRVAILLGLLILIGSIIVWMTQWRGETMRTQADIEQPSTNTPNLQPTTLITGRQHIWEIAFLPGGEMLFTERGGALNLFSKGEVKTIAQIDDVYAVGEGGLLGMAVDPQFAQNKLIYTCYNNGSDVRIVRWRMSDDLSKLQDKKAILTGILASPGGRHSGCRIAFGPDGYLWAGTGDAASGDNAIQPKTLGGKILRVDRDGKAAPGNLGGNFDARIFSYGHRNIQGLAFFDQQKHGVWGLSTEHGTGVDDEVNELRPGNFGWAPPAEGYDESVPMTDLKRFPDAVPAIWSSGDPTQAPAGAVIIKGAEWEGWDGAVAVAFLKAKHLKILRLDADNKVTKEERTLSDEYGRLRAIAQGPDGSLYVGTSNGQDDRILKLTPKQNQ